MGTNIEFEDSSDLMRRKLDSFIARIAAGEEIGYLTDVYTGSEFAPAVVTCFVACLSDADARELHKKISDLVVAHLKERRHRAA